MVSWLGSFSTGLYVMLKALVEETSIPDIEN